MLLTSMARVTSRGGECSPRGDTPLRRGVLVFGELFSEGSARVGLSSARRFWRGSVSVSARTRPRFLLRAAGVGVDGASRRRLLRMWPVAGSTGDFEPASVSRAVVGLAGEGEGEGEGGGEGEARSAAARRRAHSLRNCA